MNKLLLVGLLGVVLVGGFVFLSSYVDMDATQRPNTENDGRVSLEGTVLEVDASEIMLDGPTRITVADTNGTQHVIAIPSMGINLCAASSTISSTAYIAPGDSVVVRGAQSEDGSIVPCDDASDTFIVEGKLSDAAYGYEFTYRKGPMGYVSVEQTNAQDENFVSGITLFNEMEYQELQNSTEGREAPPSMQISVYNNSENLSASVWALRHPLLSNRELVVGDEREAIVGGANAVFYVVDGLYRTDTYVVAHGEHVYVLSGSYLEHGSTIHTDFNALVDSFTFIPYEAPQSAAPSMKIDVNAVCASALAFMTFESGEAADAFLQACINGEHPEVIQNYIDGLGIDGAMI